MSNEGASDAVRENLESERAKLEAQLGELGFGDGKRLDWDANFADTSQVTAERGETEALAASLQEGLDDTVRALAKLDEGTFGLCEDCGQPIALARLEAMPTSRFCIDCASKH